MQMMQKRQMISIQSPILKTLERICTTIPSPLRMQKVVMKQKSPHISRLEMLQI